MKKTCICSLALILSSSISNSTSIIVIATKDKIIMAVDSKVSPHGSTMVLDSIANKVYQYKDYYFVFTGHAPVKKFRAGGNMYYKTIEYNPISTVHKILKENTKIDIILSEILKEYPKTLLNYIDDLKILKAPTLAYYIDPTRIQAIVLLYKRNNVPYVFSFSFRVVNYDDRISYRGSFQNISCDSVKLSRTEPFYYLILGAEKTPAIDTGNALSHTVNEVRRLMAIEVLNDPAKIGPPIDILSFGKNVEWIQRKRITPMILK